jgi:hypothetical protein
MEGSMLCPVCQTETEKSVLFCPKCGTRIVQVQSIGNVGFDVRNIIQGASTFYKGKLLRVYIGMILIGIPVTIAFLVLGAAGGDESILRLGIFSIVVANLVPFALAEYCKAIRTRYLIAAVELVVMILIGDWISHWLRAEFFHTWYYLVRLTLPVNVAILLMIVPFFIFTFLFQLQFDINLIRAFREAGRLIVRNLPSTIIMSAVLSFLTVGAFYAYLVPGVILLPLISYAWVFYHREKLKKRRKKRDTSDEDPESGLLD